MVALKELRQGKFDIERDDQIEMKVLRELNNDHVVSTAGDPRKADFQLLLFFFFFLNFSFSWLNAPSTHSPTQCSGSLPHKK